MFENKNTELSEADVLSIKRISVPDSSPLEQSILSSTEGLSQYCKKWENSIPRKNAWFASWINVKSLTATLVTVIMITVFLWPNAFAPKPSAITAYDMTSSDVTSFNVTKDSSRNKMTSLSSEQLLDELAWQDLVLIHDQIAFSQL